MKLCLGTVQFGMDYGIQGGSRPTVKESVAMLDFAVQNGVDAIDTAATDSSRKVPHAAPTRQSSTACRDHA